MIEFTCLNSDQFWIWTFQSIGSKVIEHVGELEPPSRETGVGKVKVARRETCIGGTKSASQVHWWSAVNFPVKKFSSNEVGKSSICLNKMRNEFNPVTGSGL